MNFKITTNSWCTGITAATILILSCITAEAQKLYQISLDELKINNRDISLTVSEILDARKDKHTLGVIQKGLKNKPDLAVFEKPGLREIEQFLKSSGIYSEANGLALRITALRISEHTGNWKETAKAELSIDFFLRFENQYYYINSVFTSAEPTGMDVTKKHAANIATVIEKAFVLYSGKKNEVKPDRAFTKEELLDPSLTLRDPLSMPIFVDEKFNDGYYVSFEEFVNNQPSIGIDCAVKFGEPLKVRCDKESEEILTLYGFAHKNKLHILYHHQFFELEKRDDAFYFYGPTKMSKNPTNNIGQVYFAAGTLVVPRGTYSSLYMLDLETGTVKNMTGF